MNELQAPKIKRLSEKKSSDVGPFKSADARRLPSPLQDNQPTPCHPTATFSDNGPKKKIPSKNPRHSSRIARHLPQKFRTPNPNSRPQSNSQVSSPWTSAEAVAAAASSCRRGRRTTSLRGGAPAA